MKAEISAMIIDKKDTVAVVIEPIKSEDMVKWKDYDGQMHEITAISDIPLYHKIAICNMAKDSEVIKYGEHIGLAACDIYVGEHVHVHNVKNHREQL